MIIDFHTHIFSPKIIANRDKYLADPCFAELYKNPKARLTNAEDLIAEMDACGIGKSVILNIGWTSHNLCVESNDYILESALKYPDRLIPFIGVQPLAGASAICEIERCSKAGARGIGELRPAIQGPDLLSETVMAPLASALIANDLILLSHADEPVGHKYPGKGSSIPGVLYPFIGNHPELKIVLAHWGGGLPFYSLMPEVKEALKNVWFDSAASPYLYHPSIYKRVADLSGVDKILFGSDWPLLSPNRGLGELRSLDLPQGEFDRITGGNAAELLGL